MNYCLVTLRLDITVNKYFATEVADIVL